MTKQTSWLERENKERMGIGEALQALLEAHREAVLLEADHAVSLGLGEFESERMLALGTGEANLLGVAWGMALSGKYPLGVGPMSLLSTFVRERMCGAFGGSRRMGMSLVGVSASSGRGTWAEESQALGALLSAKETSLWVPSDVASWSSLLQDWRTSARFPLASLEFVGRGVDMLGEGKEEAVWGRMRRLSSGDDGVIFAYGRGVRVAWEAAQLCAEQGQCVGVVDCHTLLPWDKNAVSEVLAAVSWAAVMDGSVRGPLAIHFAQEILEQRVTLFVGRDGGVRDGVKAAKMKGSDLVEELLRQ